MDSLVASLRAKQLYLVQCIEKICDSHRIKYFLVGGSLLGAVKYGTFIEGDKDIENVTNRFIQFCEENKGKTVDREYIQNEYKDCTAEYIAEKILEALE